MNTIEELEIILYQQVFDSTYELKENVQLLLNSIKIHELNGAVLGSEVPFHIVIRENNKYIKPMCDPKDKKFFLTAKRLVKYKKTEIKSDEYWNVINKDGSYTFYMEGEHGDN